MSISASFPHVLRDFRFGGFRQTTALKMAGLQMLGPARSGSNPLTIPSNQHLVLLLFPFGEFTCALDEYS